MTAPTDPSLYQTGLSTSFLAHTNPQINPLHDFLPVGPPYLLLETLRDNGLLEMTSKVKTMNKDYLIQTILNFFEAYSKLKTSKDCPSVYLLKYLSQRQMDTASLKKTANSIAHSLSCYASSSYEVKFFYETFKQRNCIVKAIGSYLHCRKIVKTFFYAKPTLDDIKLPLNIWMTLAKKIFKDEPTTGIVERLKEKITQNNMQKLREAYTERRRYENIPNKDLEETIRMKSQTLDVDAIYFILICADELQVDQKSRQKSPTRPQLNKQENIPKLVISPPKQLSYRGSIPKNLEMHKAIASREQDIKTEQYNSSSQFRKTESDSNRGPRSKNSLHFYSDRKDWSQRAFNKDNFYVSHRDRSAPRGRVDESFETIKPRLNTSFNESLRETSPDSPDEYESLVKGRVTLKKDLAQQTAEKRKSLETLLWTLGLYEDTVQDNASLVSFLKQMQANFNDLVTKIKKTEPKIFKDINPKFIQKFVSKQPQEVDTNQIKNTLNIRNRFETKNADVLKLKNLKAPCEYQNITLDGFQPKIFLSKFSGIIEVDERKVEKIVKQIKKPENVIPDIFVSPQKNIPTKNISPNKPKLPANLNFDLFEMKKIRDKTPTKIEKFSEKLKSENEVTSLVQNKSTKKDTNKKEESKVEIKEKQIKVDNNASAQKGNIFSRTVENKEPMLKVSELIETKKISHDNKSTKEVVVETKPRLDQQAKTADNNLALEQESIAKSEEKKKVSVNSEDKDVAPVLSQQKPQESQATVVAEEEKIIQKLELEVQNTSNTDNQTVLEQKPNPTPISSNITQNPSIASKPEESSIKPSSNTSNNKFAELLNALEKPTDAKNVAAKDALPQGATPVKANLPLPPQLEISPALQIVMGLAAYEKIIAANPSLARPQKQNLQQETPNDKNSANIIPPVNQPINQQKPNDIPSLESKTDASKVPAANNFSSILSALQSATNTKESSSNVSLPQGATQIKANLPLPPELNLLPPLKVVMGSAYDKLLASNPGLGDVSKQSAQKKIEESQKPSLPDSSVNNDQKKLVPQALVEKKVEVESTSKQPSLPKTNFADLLSALQTTNNSKGSSSNVSLPQGATLVKGNLPSPPSLVMVPAMQLVVGSAAYEKLLASNPSLGEISKQSVQKKVEENQQPSLSDSSVNNEQKKLIPQAQVETKVEIESTSKQPSLSKANFADLLSALQTANNPKGSSSNVSLPQGATLVKGNLPAPPSMMMIPAMQLVMGSTAYEKIVANNPQFLEIQKQSSQEKPLPSQIVAEKAQEHPLKQSNLPQPEPAATEVSSTKNTFAMMLSALQNSGSTVKEASSNASLPQGATPVKANLPPPPQLEISPALQIVMGVAAYEKIMATNPSLAGPQKQHLQENPNDKNSANIVSPPVNQPVNIVNQSKSNEISSLEPQTGAGKVPAANNFSSILNSLQAATTTKESSSNVSLPQGATQIKANLPLPPELNLPPPLKVVMGAAYEKALASNPSLGEISKQSAQKKVEEIQQTLVSDSSVNNDQKKLVPQAAVETKVEVESISKQSSLPKANFSDLLSALQTTSNSKGSSSNVSLPQGATLVKGNLSAPPSLTMVPAMQLVMGSTAYEKLLASNPNLGEISKQSTQKEVEENQQPPLSDSFVNNESKKLVPQAPVETKVEIEPTSKQSSLPKPNFSDLLNALQTASNAKGSSSSNVSLPQGATLVKGNLSAPPSLTMVPAMQVVMGSPAYEKALAANPNIGQKQQQPEAKLEESPLPSQIADQNEQVNQAVKPEAPKANIIKGNLPLPPQITLESAISLVLGGKVPTQTIPSVPKKVISEDNFLAEIRKKAEGTQSNATKQSNEQSQPDLVFKPEDKPETQPKNEGAKVEDPPKEESVKPKLAVPKFLLKKVEKTDPQ